MKAIERKDYIFLLARKCKNKKKRKLLIEVADKGDIDAVTEIIANLLKGNVPLSTPDKNIFKRYKRTLRTLSKKTIPAKTKKELLIQKGGFLGSLLPLAISALSSILPSLLKQ